MTMREKDIASSIHIIYKFTQASKVPWKTGNPPTVHDGKWLHRQKDGLKETNVTLFYFAGQPVNVTSLTTTVTWNILLQVTVNVK